MAQGAKSGGFSSRLRASRPSLVVAAVFLAAETAARLAGGYELLSPLPLVRQGERIADARAGEITPLEFREGHFGAARARESWRERQRSLVWRAPPQRADTFEWIDVAPGDEKSSLLLGYPPSATLPRGVETDRHGWRATAGEPEDAAIRIAFVGSDFTFGEDDIALPSLVQAALDRMSAKDKHRVRKFQVYNLGREGLDQGDFASIITAETERIRPHIVVIENTSPFAEPGAFVESKDRGNKAGKLKAREETWGYYHAILQQPRPLSALYDSYIAPLRAQTGKYSWRFDDARGETAALSKRSQIAAALAAADRIGAQAIVLGARSAVRANQAFPRDRRMLRLNWNRRYGYVRTAHAWQLFRADATLARDAATDAGASYFSFASIAGRLRYFDDDLTLSYAGYRWAASGLAEQITEAAQRLPSE